MRRVVPEAHVLRLRHCRIEPERVTRDVVPVWSAAYDVETSPSSSVEERRRGRADAAGQRPSLGGVTADDRVAHPIARSEADLTEGTPEVERLARLYHDAIEAPR